MAALGAEPDRAGRRAEQGPDLRQPGEGGKRATSFWVCEAASRAASVQRRASARSPFIFQFPAISRRRGVSMGRPLWGASGGGPRGRFRGPTSGFRGATPYPGRGGLTRGAGAAGGLRLGRRRTPGTTAGRGPGSRAVRSASPRTTLRTALRRRRRAVCDRRPCPRIPPHARHPRSALLRRVPTAGPRCRLRGRLSGGGGAGRGRRILAVVGDLDRVRQVPLAVFPGVERVVVLTSPHTLASLAHQPEPTVVDVGGVRIGGGGFVVIAGPCAVEDEADPPPDRPGGEGGRAPTCCGAGRGSRAPAPTCSGGWGSRACACCGR